VVVENYRAACDVVLRDQRGEADTELLRKAIVHYRALFAELLEADDAVPQPALNPSLPLRRKPSMDTRQDTETRKLTTADLAAASQQRAQTDRSAREEQRQPRPSDANAAKREEELAALFVPDAAKQLPLAMGRSADRLRRRPGTRREGGRRASRPGDEEPRG
jgi:hypothetical protein